MRWDIEDPEKQDKQVVENSQPFSVELSTNAKGQHQWMIRLIGSDLDKLTAEVSRIDDLLSEKYKMERIA